MTYWKDRLPAICAGDPITDEDVSRASDWRTCLIGERYEAEEHEPAPETTFELEDRGVSEYAIDLGNAFMYGIKDHDHERACAAAHALERLPSIFDDGEND